MRLTPPTAPLPPFWAAVRRRHPDVDIVVLPDERPAGDVAEVAGPEAEATALVAVERVTAAARDLAGDPEAGAALGYGPAEGTVVARARVSAGRPDGRDALVALWQRLATEGWEVHRLEDDPKGDLMQLVGRTPGLHLRATYAESTGAFLLELTSDPLVVGRRRARALVRR